MDLVAYWLLLFTYYSIFLLPLLLCLFSTKSEFFGWGYRKRVLNLWFCSSGISLKLCSFSLCPMDDEEEVLSGDDNFELLEVYLFRKGIRPWTREKLPDKSSADLT